MTEKKPEVDKVETKVKEERFFAGRVPTEYSDVIGDRENPDTPQSLFEAVADIQNKVTQILKRLD